VGCPRTPRDSGAAGCREEHMPESWGGLPGIRTRPADEMRVAEVGPAVNSPRNDGPECLDAAYPRRPPALRQREFASHRRGLRAVRLHGLALAVV
jgi:hypothetical protein